MDIDDPLNFNVLSEHSLSTDLLLRAQKELHEKPEWRQRDVAELRRAITDYIEKNKSTLQPCLTDAFLIRFLRSRKFDYDRSLELFLRYYQVRREYSDIFDNLLPSRCEISQKEVISLLTDVGYQGNRILLIDLGQWNPTLTCANDLIRLLLLILECSACYQATQICGLAVIIDMRGVHASTIFNYCTPTVLKKLAAILEDSFPLRATGIHIVHESYLMDALMIVLKPFVSDRIRRKLHFHGQNVRNLHDYIDRCSLPISLDGSVDAFPMSTATRLQRLECYFVRLSAFGFVQSFENGSDPLNTLRSMLSCSRTVCIDTLNS